MDWYVASRIKLEPGERILNYWRQSRLVLFYRSLLPVIEALIALAIFIVGSAATGLGQTLALVVVFAAIPIVLTQTVLVVVEWYVRIFVLTNRRLIRREGIISRSRLEIQLSKVQNTFVTYAYIQKWLGLGTVITETASAGLDLRIDMVRGAKAISQEILSAAEGVRAQIAQSDEDRIRRMIGEHITMTM